MRLIAGEWRKLARMPALWVYLALCLAFNALIIINDSYGRDYFNAVSAVTAELGTRADSRFLSALSARTRTDNQNALLDTALQMENIFADYDTDELAQAYQNVVGSSSAAASWLTWKYGLLQSRVDHLAQTGAAMDLYAGAMTYDSFQFLFSSLIRAIVTEGILLGMLSALYLLGYERVSRTEGAFCTSRVGRRLWRSKVLAALTAGVILYIPLALCSLGLYFSLWDYSGVWSSSISSQFNYWTDLTDIFHPFITWGDFTVAGYLAAVLALGGALIAVFTLLAAACGIVIRNTYIAAVSLLILCAGSLFLSSLLGEAGLWAAFMLTYFGPVQLWLSIDIWFTEMGLYAILPWQETVGTALNLTLWGALTLLALKRFGRKDVA